MIKEQMNLRAIKRINKGKKLEQLTSYCLKLLEDGIMQDGVESICNVYLKAPPNQNGHPKWPKYHGPWLHNLFLPPPQTDMVTNEK